MDIWEYIKYKIEDEMKAGGFDTEATNARYRWVMDNPQLTFITGRLREEP